VQDIDITFTMSGTADNGTTFGAAIDLDENAAGVGLNDAGVAIFISGDLGTLTLGDTDGGRLGDEEVAVAGARSTTMKPPTPASTATLRLTVTTTVRSCATTTPSATSPSRSRSSRTTTTLRRMAVRSVQPVGARLRVPLSPR
jgi:hypothetical protein